MGDSISSSWRTSQTLDFFRPRVRLSIVLVEVVGIEPNVQKDIYKVDYV